LAAIIRPNGRWNIFPAKKQIRIIGDTISPGLENKTNYIYMIFPRPDENYELKYSAHAENLSEPNTGILVVRIQGRNSEPDKRFPEDEDE
jgi:hypothetical protein